MPGVSVSWDEAVPADADSLGAADDVIRSTKSAIRTGLGAEHNWPAAGGLDVGYHLKGSARAFVAAQSLVSAVGPSAQGDGRMLIASDTSRLFGCGSAGTVLLGGGPNSLSLGTFPGSLPQRHHWVMEVGADPMTGVNTITFPNSGFSGVPYVQCSAHSGDALTGIALTVTSITKTEFTVLGSRCTVIWSSTGTRVL